VYVVENNDLFDTLQTNEKLSRMPDISFDYVDIVTRLKKLYINKSEGPDGIHPRVLSENAEILAYPLKIVIEKSFKLNALPLDWRSGNITTIFIKGSKLEPEYHRLVSLTFICCKIMESIIRQSITDHFLDNNAFSNKQFGFIKGRSTVMQLLNVMYMWT